MPDTGTVLRTEVRGLELCLLDNSLALLQSGETLVPPIALSPEEANRVALQMTKAQLPEWNQLQELKTAADKRYRGYLGSWLVMCLAAFSAYLGYPSYYLCIFLSLLSLFLWWRTGFMENKAAQEAQAERNAFRPDWQYLRQRLEELEVAAPAEP
jgi:hypothetical protein